MANDEALGAMEEFGSLADKQAVAMDIEKALYEFQTNGAFSEADPKAHQALVAFHSLNLDSRQAATGQVAAESIKALLEALGLPATPEVLAAAAGAAAVYIGGKRVIAGLSENGKPKPLSKSPDTANEHVNSQGKKQETNPIVDSEVAALERIGNNAKGPDLTNKAPNTVLDLQNAKAGSGDWAKLSGQLRDASAGKGNFSIGTGTREQSDALGKAWVGDGYKVASDGRTLVSSDGLRQYRPPSYKPNQGKSQANFEQRFPGQESKKWQSNAHLNITD